MLTKPPECWSIDPNAHAVRVEASTDQSILLPFEHLLYSELRKQSGSQTLLLAFVTHQVTLHGTSLRKIETALQRKELAHLAVTVPGTEKLASEGLPIIRKITVDLSERGSAETEE